MCLDVPSLNKEVAAAAKIAVTYERWGVGGRGRSTQLAVQGADETAGQPTTDGGQRFEQGGQQEHAQAREGGADDAM